MSIAGVLLTVLVVLLVFNPARLPELARQVGRLVRQMNQLRAEIARMVQYVSQEQQYQDNKKKAEQADVLYQTQNESGLMPPGEPECK